MSVIHITHEDVAQALKDVVREYGEGHVYTPPRKTRGGQTSGMAGCYYTHTQAQRGDDNPDETLGCIVGHVLNKLGISIPQLNHAAAVDDSSYGSCDAAELMRRLSRDEVATYTPEVPILLMTAQGPQDVGITWGVCLASAMRQYGPHEPSTGSEPPVEEDTA